MRTSNLAVKVNLYIYICLSCQRLSETWSAPATVKWLHTQLLLLNITHYYRALLLKQYSSSNMVPIYVSTIPHRHSPSYRYWDSKRSTTSGKWVQYSHLYMSMRESSWNPGSNTSCNITAPPPVLLPPKSLPPPSTHCTFTPKRKHLACISKML